MKRTYVNTHRRLHPPGGMQNMLPSRQENKHHLMRFALNEDMNLWLALIALSFGFFMSVLDTSIVNISLPTIQMQFHTDLITTGWISYAYNLTFAVLMITVGRFADQYGRKRLFLLGIGIFGLGSLLCATSPSIGWLVGFRVLQACGAALLNTVSLAIITAVFPADKRNAALGIWGAIALSAAAFGPVLGGILVQDINWNAIFLINLPFCIAGFLMTLRYVPETYDSATSKKIDFPGLAALSTTLFCLALAIIKGSDWGWTSGGTLALFGAAIVSLFVLIQVEIKQDDPMIDMKLFLIPSFSASSLAMLLYDAALQGSILIIGLYYMNTQGYTQLDAAYRIIPVPLTAFAVSLLSSRINRSITPPMKVLIGMALFVVGFVLLSMLPTHASYPDIIWRALIIGIGTGLCFGALPAIALVEVPRSKLGVGSGVFNTARQIGFTLGVTILLSLLTSQMKGNLATVHHNVTSTVQMSTILPPQLRNDVVTRLSHTIAAVQQSESIRSVSTAAQISQLASGKAFQPLLMTLNGYTDDLIQEALVNAFKMTWLIAGLIALLGVPLILFIALSQQKKQAVSPMPVPSGWSGLYFFSPEGYITQETIMHYHNAQKEALGPTQYIQATKHLNKGKGSGAYPTV